MNVLVTGATGFLGKRLAFRLNEMGYDVTAIGRNEFIGNELKKNDINFISCDLRDKDAIIKACKGSDYVIHSGALSAIWGRYNDFYDVNVNGTSNIIEGCKKSNIKSLVHISTSSIYFDMQDRIDILENAELPQKPINYYAKTKLLAEKEIDKAFIDGVPAITIRPRGIFGPGDTSIIPRLIQTNEKFGVPIVNGGKALIDVTYVGNVIDAILLCMDAKEEYLGKKYNITNGEPIYFIDLLTQLFQNLNCEFKPREISFNNAYSIASIMEFISRTVLIGREPLLTKYTVGMLSKSQTLNIQAAQKDFGYFPKVTIEKGIVEFAKWWNEKNVHN